MLHPEIQELPAEERIESHETGLKGNLYWGILPVRVFTHQMGDKEFTVFTTYFAWRKFTRTYPRAYHRRWIFRLAKDFAHDVFNSMVQVERWKQ